MSVPIKLVNARLAACRKQPYLSVPILSMIPVSRPGMGTIGVSSRWVLFYDPEFIENTPPDELAGVVLHEVAHLVLKHHKRCQALVNVEMTPLFNAACFVAGTSVTMADGSTKPIELVSAGDLIVGENNGRPCVGTVVARLVKSANRLVRVRSGAVSVICTPEHHFLTENGYVAAEELKQEAGCTIYRRGEFVCSGELQIKNYQGNVYSLGSFISGCDQFSKTKPFDSRTSHRQEHQRIAVSRIAATGVSVFFRDDRHLRSDLHQSPLGQQKEKGLLPTYDGNHGLESGDCRLVSAEGFQSATYKEQYWVDILLNHSRWLQTSQSIRTHLAVFSGKVSASGLDYRILESANEAASTRSAVSENVADSEASAGFAQQNYVARAASGSQQETVYDLVTTCHSYVANGFVVHNCDLAVNEMLRSQGVKLPEGCLYPETFKLPTGQPAEVYYRMLLDQAKKPEDMPQTPFAGGSCSDGVPREWEIVADENEEAGTVNETDASMNETVGEVNKNTVSVNNQPGYEDYEIEQILRKVAEVMQRGNVPGCFKRAAEEILNPKVDPRRLLMRALQRHTSTLMNGGGKYSYRRPARRPSLGGTIRPRAFQPVPKITVIVDTSGSMNDRDLGLCVGFVAKVLSGLRLRDGVHVIVGDAKVQGDMQCLDAKKLKLSGGGGTSMKRLIEHAASAKDKPGLIIVCTDSETDWSNRDLGIPVVACLTREEGSYYKVPSWIEKVVMG